jgi:glutamate racemase
VSPSAEVPPRPADDRPIGVFDSGVGGLTVLRALEAALPHESFLYLGDTARLPYGTKSPASVVRYATQCARVLVGRGTKAIVIACNTAASAALPALVAGHPGIPVVGVVEPGAMAALAATRNRRVLVLATEGTIRAGAYQAALQRLAPDVQVRGVGCSVFVALAEEGWGDSEVAEHAARRYLGAIYPHPAAPDTVLLGCTHFPVLVPTLSRLLPPGVRLVDSAATTAAAVARLVAEGGLAAAGPDAGAATRFLATDGAERFARVGSQFLARPLTAGDIEIVDVA